MKEIIRNSSQNNKATKSEIIVTLVKSSDIRENIFGDMVAANKQQNAWIIYYRLAEASKRRLEENRIHKI